MKLRNPIRGRKLLPWLLVLWVWSYLKLRNPIRGRKPIPRNHRKDQTRFEIKKPHKGTETNSPAALQSLLCDLKLRNPIRGRKPYLLSCINLLLSFEIKKPHKGTETLLYFSTISLIII